MKKFLDEMIQIQSMPPEVCKEHKPNMSLVALCSLPGREKITTVCKLCGKKLIAKWKEEKCQTE